MNDTLPWLKIVVDRPLNRRLSDDRLVGIASKAEGRLQLLHLISCFNITDHGLLRVIAQNPHISKLHVLGCASFTPGGLVRAVEELTKGNHRLKSLKIRGIPGVHKEDLQTLQNLIHPKHEKKRDKIFYHKETDSSPIDVDMCPICSEVRTVFDCPRSPCKCRGCGSCIMRRTECSVCVQESEAACCADALCLACWLELPKCNFCNKPYCSRHAHQQYRDSESAGFICATCHSRFS